jgi:protein-S-isoprenylcysteine O-methyltransferase Ste14
MARRVAAPIGGVLLVTGVGLAASFIAAFLRAGTPVDPRQAPTSLVTTGPYRLTRNPGYLALAMVSAGIALVSGALWPLLTLVPTLVVIDRGVIAREERYLERRFGDEYVRFTENQALALRGPGVLSRARRPSPRAASRCR